MSEIDFSNAPDGATHYSPESEMMHVVWYKAVKKNSHDASCHMEGSGWKTCTVNDAQFDIHRNIMIPIPLVVNNDSIITCKTEREVMLCKQVIRMCRGEASQQLFKGDWYDFDSDSYEFYINEQYREKLKKELVIPWEWIADDVYRVEVGEGGKVTTISTKYNNESIPLKLDLDGVDLPTIIDRPSEK